MSPGSITVNTLCLKKVPIFKLSVTFSNLYGFAKNFWANGKHIKFATKPIRHYPPHFRDVATLLWKIKKSNFSRYSTDMDENTNKLDFKFTAFNSTISVTVYAE